MITLSLNDVYKLQTLIDGIKTPSSSAVSTLLSRIQHEINSMRLSESMIDEVRSIIKVIIEHPGTPDEARLYRPRPRQSIKINDDEMILFSYIIQINNQSMQNEISNDIGR